MVDRVNWRDHLAHVSKRHVLVSNLLGPAESDSDTFALTVMDNMQVIARHLVQPGQTGDYHVHFNQEQVYFFLEGTAKMHVDERIYPVRPGSIIALPATCYHQLINDGDEWTAHLLIAGARIPEDQQRSNQKVIATNGPSGSKLPIAARHWSEVSPQDGYLGGEFVWELLRATEVATIGGVDYCRLYPGNGQRDHRHADHEQALYVVKGRGAVKLEGETADIREGDMVYVPTGAKHAVTNLDDNWLEYLAIDALPS